MKLKYILSLAWDSMRHRKLRSWLTILGIVIGVAAVISLISISMGMSEQISSRMNTLGTNIITISPGGVQAQKFMGPAMAGGGQGGSPPGGRSVFDTHESSVITFREADNLRTLPGVYKVDARIQKRMTVAYRDKNTSLSVIGTEPDSFGDTVGVDIFSGRYLSSNDQYSAVIGFAVANSTFNDFDMLNKQIKIGGTAFRVVGVLQQTGIMSGTDNSVFIPQRVAKTVMNQSSAVSEVIVVVSEDHDTDEVAETVEAALMNLHGVTSTNKDFQVSTAATMQAAVSSVTDTLGLFLGGIASISLIVGGIGVANTMYMSVLEQTKEIGVLKSLGAKNRDVISLFLCEAGMIGLVGGVFGVLLSFVLSFAIQMFGLPSAPSLELILFGLFFSVVIGLVAGLPPARNAARIPPVEALKYE